PLLVVFYFAMQFINRGIDTWFNVEVEAGLDDALALSQAALGTRMRDHLNTTIQIAERLRDVDGRELIFQLGILRRESGASEITLFGRGGRIIAMSSDELADSLPEPAKEEMLMQIHQDRPYVNLDSVEEGIYEIRTAVRFPADGREAQAFVRAVFPVNERLGRMASNVERSYSDYKRAVYLREPLKRTISITLTVVLMISLLASVYGAFFFSRRLVAPIQDLVAGTRAVAKGDFDTRLPTPSR